MIDENLFPKRPDVSPKVYAYSLPGVNSYEGYIKVGYTEQKDVNERIRQQLHTAGLSESYKLLGEWDAIKDDGSAFTDHDVHSVLDRKGFVKLNAEEDRNEWFKCSIEDIESAVISVKTGNP